MFKSNNIYLRLFEPSDFEQTYQWRNDMSIVESTCGTIRFVSKEIERNWVATKSTSNNRDIYLAICSNETNAMIGYISINDIDYINRKCVFGGIVIGKENETGFAAYIESVQLILSYVFDQLNMNRISESCLSSHKTSIAQSEAFYFEREGLERESIYKNGKYHDVITFSLLRKDYYYHLSEGDYKFNILVKNLAVRNNINK